MLDDKRWISDDFLKSCFSFLRSYRISAIFFSLIFFSDLPPALPQRNVLRIDGSVKEEKEKLEGVSVSVFKDEQFVAKSVTESNGKFRFQLEYDSEYILEFSKPGFVTKRVSIITDSVPLADQDFGHEYGGWELSLFRMAEGLDITMFEKPFVKIAFNPDLNKFEHDVEYTNLIKKEFEQLQKDVEKKKKEEAKKKKEEAKAAEKALSEAAARQKSEEDTRRSAEAEKEAEKEREAKAARIAQAKLNQEERKKAKEAEAKTDEEKNAKAKASFEKSEEDYMKLISLADNEFNKKEYEKAKFYYQDAQKLKPRENFPAQRILEINSLLNQASLSVNKARRDTGEYKTKEEFLQALAKLYPQGMTEEIYMEGNVKITRRIMVDGKTGMEYKMAEHPWGGRFWFKNGTPINESVWNIETQVKKK